MVECKNGGRIVNTASVAGLNASGTLAGGMSHYGLSKAALINMTKNAAIEYIPERIRVNAVAPSTIETPMVKAFIEASENPEMMRKQANMNNPMGQHDGLLPQVSDVTGVVSFLVGPDAKYINGQTISIDGGYTVQ